jgi:hypothetical protein
MPDWAHVLANFFKKNITGADDMLFVSTFFSKKIPNNMLLGILQIQWLENESSCFF